MYGLGIAKSLGVTMRHFIVTYLDDLKWLFKGGFGSRYTPEALPERQSPSARGIFTIQYPDEEPPLPERFRVFPFHVIDPETGKSRCTACGMCARVCPPQCIWIKRGEDPETGRPAKEPAEFYIDVSICMSCGLCAEACPFDAIKMDQDYEVAAYERFDSLLWDLDKLTEPQSYDVVLHPSDYATDDGSSQ